MRKFKIFLFIEACLLTGALILMVSEHFSRFLLIPQIIHTSLN